MRQLINQFYCYFIVLVCMVAMTGCGGNQRDNQEPTPTDAGRPILNIYGPVGAKGAFEAFQVISEIIDVPYELRVFEGNTDAPGIQGVLDETFDLMVLMRQPRLDEPLAFVEWLQTPVALFVHPGAGIEDLTREQAAAVFSGAVTNWSELGGMDQDIVVLVQEVGDTNTEIVADYLLQGRPVIDTEYRLLSDLDILTMVDSVPGSIGYAAWAAKKYYEFISSAQYLAAVTLDGVPPDDPVYPMVSVIGIAYRPERESYLQPLFDWGDGMMASEAVKLLAEQFGIIVSDTETTSAP